MKEYTLLFLDNWAYPYDYIKDVIAAADQYLHDDTRYVLELPRAEPSDVCTSVSIQANSLQKRYRLNVRGWARVVWDARGDIVND